MNYVNVEKLGSLMSGDSLLAYVKSGVFEPRISHIIMMCLKKHHNQGIDQLSKSVCAADVVTTLLEQMAGDGDRVREVQRVVNAIKELFYHYDLAFSDECLVLPTVVCESVKRFRDSEAGSYGRGYVNAVTEICGVEDDKLQSHASAWLGLQKAYFSQSREEEEKEKEEKEP